MYIRNKYYTYMYVMSNSLHIDTDAVGKNPNVRHKQKKSFKTNKHIRLQPGDM